MAKVEPTEEVQTEAITEETLQETLKPKEEPKEAPKEPEKPSEEEPLQETEKPKEPEETPEEEPVEDAGAVEEEGEKEAPQPEHPISRRKAERLAKLENLVSSLKGTEAPEAPAPIGMDYRTEVGADEETATALEADRQKAANSSFYEGLERAKSIQFHTKLEIDAPKVESKYSIFDKDSPEFRPETADAINRWYLTSVGYNPKTDSVTNQNVRYSDFVDGIMELADSMAGAKVETTQKNIAKQAANTGIRPDGSTTKLNLNKAPQDMTDEELSAVIKRSARNLQK